IMLARWSANDRGAGFTRLELETGTPDGIMGGDGPSDIVWCGADEPTGSVSRASPRSGPEGGGTDDEPLANQPDRRPGYPGRRDGRDRGWGRPVGGGRPRRQLRPVGRGRPRRRLRPPSRPRPRPTSPVSAPGQPTPPSIG